jgi:plasmid stability protein
MDIRMPINLSIKNAPDDVVAKLKERAKRNHRSLQGEVMAILEDAAKVESKALTPRDALAHMRALGVRTKDEAVQLIREDRDNR